MLEQNLALAGVSTGRSAMQILEAANRSHLPAKTIRYYEDIRLLAPSARMANGYRDYSKRDVQRLCFIQRARGLGFSIADCRELLSLYQDRKRSSADVRAIAIRRLKDVKRKLKELETLRVILFELTSERDGDEVSDLVVPKNRFGRRHDG